jgi:tetratricopeptide (TPR) repeat protein
MSMESIPRDANSLLDEVSLLMEQGRHEQAQAILAGIDPGTGAFGQSRLLLVRGYCEQGLLRKAGETVVKAPGISCDPVTAARLKLWSLYLAMYQVVPSPDNAPFEGLLTQVEAICRDTTSDLSVRATALDLKQRALMMQIALGIIPSRRRAEVASQMAGVTEAYHAAGEPVEAIRCCNRTAGFLLNKPYDDVARARELLSDVVSGASGLGRIIIAQDAGLALTNLDFEDALAARPERQMQIEPWVDRYREIERQYGVAGHLYGSERVTWSLARLLLSFGFEAGAPLARETAESLERLREIVIRQEIWKALNLWHTHRGESAAAEKARHESEKISEEMEFGLGNGTDLLASADRALRAGRYGEARETLLRVAEEAKFPSLRAASRLNLAHLASRSGRRDEALGLLNDAIDEFEREDNSFYLPLALFSRAMYLAIEDFDGACRDLGSLIELDLLWNDTLALGSHLAARGWLTYQYRRSQAFTPNLSDEVKADFDDAERALSHLRTFEARRELVDFYQHRGQVGMMEKDWAACGEWLAKAETVARAAGLGPQLAFTLTYQGLALIQLGRSRGIANYDHAAQRFDEAREWFEKSGLSAMVWSVVFYRGLCDREAGMQETWGSDAQKGRWARAHAYFEEAVREINIQRGAVGTLSAADTMTQGIAFAGDKQEVYREGFQLCHVLLRDESESIRWLERMKGRTLLDVLAGTALPPTGTDLPRLIEQEQDLRRMKRESTSFTQVMAIQAEIDEVIEQMTRDAKTAGYASLRRPEPPPWGEILETLRQEQLAEPNRRIVIAEWYCTKDSAVLFGMRADWDAPRSAPIPLNHGSFSNFINTWFRSPGGVSRLKNVGASGERAWNKFEALLTPLADWSEPGDVVCLIPHNVLHDLPLHTLKVGGNRLIDRNTVTFAPSLSALHHLMCRRRARDATSANNAPLIAAFGNPTGDLPGAEDEIEHLANLLGCEPVIGSFATRERIFRGLAEADEFIYSGHASHSQAKGFLSGLKASDGVITASDLFTLPRVARYVILSGCETGVHENRVGDELIGFVPALLAGGADSVLVAQWRIYDESTRVLMRKLFERVRDRCKSPAESLREGIHEVRANPLWSHFYYWGGLVVHGHWR